MTEQELKKAAIWPRTDVDRGIAVLLGEDGPEAWYYDDPDVWRRDPAGTDIFAAWALDERAIAAAERALRKAEEDHLCGDVEERAGQVAVMTAILVLRELGIEP